MIVKLIVSVLDVMLKLFVAWLTYLLAKWIQAPEWAMIALIVMSVQSTFITVNQS